MLLSRTNQSFGDIKKILEEFQGNLEDPSSLKEEQQAYVEQEKLEVGWLIVSLDTE